MDIRMETTEKKHQNGTKLIYRQLLKQWSEQTRQKLPNKGSQTVHNTYKIPHKLNGTENCKICEKIKKRCLLLLVFFKVNKEMQYKWHDLHLSLVCHP